ncbi:hypothetical protein [[Limnothrix rosea] IAM M-220]|uniref:hypothetical protein n=1 Tax=[Limnothrix rosea] IAM M-220 TaxID=454133 RepID=UPI00095C81B7|nr:hypothetical protein [[Limnothrix rosea] IAM M-220]OKH18466.1 hypothetical protein NIES208_05765 [[Limnothrix rosea] IAM M-220]
MNLSTKKLVCFGLVGGTLVSFNAPAIAQVQVTGGDFSGAAGFFLPDMVDVGAGKNVKLLDATVETLNLESEIGNTSTAVFVPTAARFDNNIDPTMATVDQGDTGALQGLLTGLAYDNDGYPVIFTSVATQLDFAVDTFNFDTANSLMGTLIQPEVVGAAPLVFINQPVTLTTDSDEDFEAVAGQLDVGILNANLEGGEFNLPSTWSFAGGSSGGGSNPTPSLERRVKFKFYGEDVVASSGTDLDTTDDEIRFIGAANEKFQIQTVGTRSTAEFKIKADDADDAFVDITLGGPFSKLEGDSTEIDLTQELDYKIKGEAEGNFTALLGNVSAVAEFEGTARKDVDFEFEQGSNEFSGRSDGSVNFIAAVGGTELINNGDDDTNVGLGACNVCADDETGNAPTTVATSVRFLSITDLLDDTSDDPDNTLSDSDDVNDLSEDEYEALEKQLAEVDIDIDIDIDITVIDKGLDRYYVAHRNKSKGKHKGQGRGKKKKGYYENEVFCFRQVGPGSSIFPGLIGLVQIDFDDIPLEVFVGLPEIADADIDDDVDIDVDVDDSDTGSDSDSDDDDDDDNDDDLDSDDDDNDDDSDSDDDDSSDSGNDVIIIEGLPEINDGTDSGSDSGNSGSDGSSSDDVIIIEGLPEIQ